ncbi:sugar kinase [Thalassotalea sp. PLHSN55]|uniref:sugar kinase n=1 Tax=Thalassotalea sp. PLHSN55 TaxID=3435888 RepID=UPI003F87942B
MKKMLVIGECMMELKESSATTMAKSFAGDVYNTAIYAKRWFPEAQISFLTAIGKDPISQQFEMICQEEGIDQQAMLHSDDRHMGIYSITTDEHGERSFTYWRNQSAATQMMPMLAGNYSSLCQSQFDLVYFSGISLAILSVEDRTTLFELLAQLKSSGAKIAFDPNYRAHMWPSKAEAKHWLEKSYACSDIVLPGLEDHQDLLGHQNVEEILAYLGQFSVSEIVIKCGKDGVYSYAGQEADFHLPFSPADTQVDSTAAGDSFAGTYLATRLHGHSLKTAVNAAADTAKFVIQHHGAIVKSAIFDEFLVTYTLVS